MDTKRIFIYGVPGTGKTFTSKIVAKKTGLDLVEGDRIKMEILKDPVLEVKPFFVKGTCKAYSEFGNLTPDNAVKGLKAVREALNPYIIQRVNNMLDSFILEGAFLDPKVLMEYGHVILLVVRDEIKHKKQFLANRSSILDTGCDEFTAARYNQDFMIDEAKKLGIQILENDNGKDISSVFNSSLLLNSNNEELVDIVSCTSDLWKEYRDIRLRSLKDDPQAFAKQYKDELKSSNEKWIQRASNPYNHLAIENGKPIGIVGAFIINEDGNNIANIYGVFVDKEARGRGLASKLLDAVIKKIEQDSTVKTVKLSVNKDQLSAIKLYEKFGFNVVGEDEVIMGDGLTHFEYQMELKLKFEDC